MTLAVAILLFGIYSAGLSSQENLAPAQAAEQSGPGSASSSRSNPEQSPSSTAPATAPPQSSTSKSQETAPSSTTSAAKKRGRKKKPAIAPCNASNSAGQASGANSANGSNASSTPPSTETSATPPATNCPPPKIVVRQGGTVEPSIQLAGGDQAAQKRDKANQMLGSTEANLKKIAGLQLSEAQKGTVVQIRQFVDQSKAALAAGDVERGNTLAWKAQLLSDDLVQPQK